MELNSYHFGIHLNDHTFQPVADPVIVLIVITINFNDITDLIVAVLFRG
jgi:hypothetical protein